MTWQVEPYRPGDAPAWDAFVDASRNGTFLFRRAYMDYHAERFVDASCVVRRNGRIAALLPANIVGDRIVCHGGLSYGALLVDARSGQREVQSIFEHLRDRFAAQGLRHWRYKTVPPHFHRLPAEDDRYALYRLGARWWRSEVLSVIAPGTAPRRAAGRRHALRRAAGTAGVELRHDPCWDHFWPLQAEVLAQRHGLVPVHSLAEIRLLAQRFPDRIRLVTCWLDGRIAAGGVLFQTDRVLRTQYLAAGDAARRLGLLDLVVDHAIEVAREAGLWFDFGISTVDDGLRLNDGLLAWKESFGAHTLVHDGFELDLR